MKKQKLYIRIVFLIILYLNCVNLVAQESNKNTGFVLKAKVIKSDDNQCVLKVDVENVSKADKSILIMSCSYYEDFRISNENLKFENQVCDKNFRKEFKIKSKKTKVYYLTLKKSKLEFFKTKIGLVLISKTEDVKTSIIWSNYITI